MFDEENLHEDFVGKHGDFDTHSNDGELGVAFILGQKERLLPQKGINQPVLFLELVLSLQDVQNQLLANGQESLVDLEQLGRLFLEEMIEQLVRGTGFGEGIELGLVEEVSNEMLSQNDFVPDQENDMVDDGKVVHLLPLFIEFKLGHNEEVGLVELEGLHDGPNVAVLVLKQSHFEERNLKIRFVLLTLLAGDFGVEFVAQLQNQVVEGTVELDGSGKVGEFLFEEELGKGLETLQQLGFKLRLHYSLEFNNELKFGNAADELRQTQGEVRGTHE